MVSEYVLKNEAWDGARASFAKGYEKGKREAADTIDRLTHELAEARDKALEEAAKVADMWAIRTATEADHLRKLRDYARAKQLVSEAEGAQRIAAATRALKEKP